MRLDEFADLARSRRTHMLVDKAQPVSAELVDELCEIATWAPNHKRTWPWRFAHLTGDARSRLGRAFAADMIDAMIGDEPKRTKTLTKYERTPSIVVVACEPHDHPTFHAENRDAVAAAIQTFLLAATAAGLASFWSTPPVMSSPRTLDLCGFGPGDRIAAVIYLGWPSAEVEAPVRPPAHVNHIN